MWPFTEYGPYGSYILLFLGMIPVILYALVYVFVIRPRRKLKRTQRLEIRYLRALQLVKHLASLNVPDANRLAEDARLNFLKYLPEFQGYIKQAEEFLKESEK